jgi:hypothetical protein
MRALELHIIETASDVDLAIKAGLLEPHRLDYTSCSDCDDTVGHAATDEAFEPFCVVIDADDNDWVVCIDCASPITDGDLRKVVEPEMLQEFTNKKKLLSSLVDEYLDDDDLDEF